MYNKKIFEQKLNEFVNDIVTRRKEVDEGIYESTKVVGKSLFSFIPYIREDFPIIYSTCSVRFDSICKRKTTTPDGLHIASLWNDIECLYNGIKYQILAHKDKYTGISEDEFVYVYYGYFTILAKNYNWTRTFNIDGKHHYLDWYWADCNILKGSKARELYKSIFIDNDNTVIDINGQIKKINIKNSNYNTMKRLTKEELLNLISQFNLAPSVKELTAKYMESIDLIDTSNITDESEFIRLENENRAKTISPELMRKYIKEYGLESLIKTCNHSKEFFNKQKKH